MTQTFKQNLEREKHSFKYEVVAIAVILLAVFSGVAWYGIKQQDRVLKDMQVLSGTLTALTTNFGNAYRELKVRQEEARQSAEGIQNALTALSLAIGEVNQGMQKVQDSIKRQEKISINLAETARRQQRVAPKRATKKDVERFKQVIE